MWKLTILLTSICKPFWCFQMFICYYLTTTIALRFIKLYRQKSLNSQFRSSISGLFWRFQMFICHYRTTKTALRFIKLYRHKSCCLLNISYAEFSWIFVPEVLSPKISAKKWPNPFRYYIYIHRKLTYFHRYFNKDSSLSGLK